MHRDCFDPNFLSLLASFDSHHLAPLADRAQLTHTAWGGGANFAVRLTVGAASLERYAPMLIHYYMAHGSLR
jgi:hypothetical protein